MKFYLLPYNSFTIETKLLPQQVSETLDDLIEPDNLKVLLWPYGIDKPFRDRISNDKFKIFKVICHSYPSPVITGKFHQKDRKTIIRIIMRLNLPAICFLLFWFGCLVVKGFPSGWHAYVTNHDAMILLVVTGMFLFAAGLVLGCFWPEANRAEQILREAFSETDGIYNHQ